MKISILAIKQDYTWISMPIVTVNFIDDEAINFANKSLEKFKKTNPNFHLYFLVVEKK